ncbi:MAG: hypothetical protein MUE60_02350 [Candidatus Eisenbacteria bacterium]|jgi:hypothetical protein|nr:hypothetical protein [Candidatus Eisenbacteria bacterium]
MKALTIFGWVVLGIAGVAALGLVLGLVVQHLWNWLMPPIFGLTAIGYWQAVGLFVLGHLLFGGHPAHHKGHGSKKHPFACKVRAAVHGEAAPPSD